MMHNHALFCAWVLFRHYLDTISLTCDCERALEQRTISILKQIDSGPSFLLPLLTGHTSQEGAPKNSVLRSV